jgi:amino acid transporter
VLIAFGVMGVMLYCTIQALGELAVAFPVAGSFSSYSTRFLDPAWGFAMGWNFAVQWLIVLPLELIAASITISYWNPGVPRAVFVGIFLLLIVGINLFGAKGYGEAEFVFSIVKVVAVLGFIILGIVIDAGGTPGTAPIGTAYWREPGAFKNGFKGLCSVLVMAAFAFGGTEFVGLAAAETANPRKALPSACKQVFWRITIFYMATLAIIGLVVRHDDGRLLHGGSASTAASPFVLAITDAGIAALPSLMNGVILVAVLSVGNSAVYGSSRTLQALARSGQAPRIFGFVDRRGRPMAAVALAAALGLVAFTADAGAQGDVLAWMLALSGLSQAFTWGSICAAHLRFRAGWRRQGRARAQLAVRAQSGTAGSWLGLVVNALVVAAQFWTGAWPVGHAALSTAQRLVHFFQAFLAVPVVVLCYAGFKLVRRPAAVTLEAMDLVTGERGWDVAELLRRDAEERRAWTVQKRVWRFLC